MGDADVDGDSFAGSLTVQFRWLDLMVGSHSVCIY